MPELPELVLDTIRRWPSSSEPPTLDLLAHVLVRTLDQTRLAVEELKRRGLVVEEPWWPDEGLVLRARRGSA